MEQSKINSKQTALIGLLCSRLNISKEDKKVMVMGFSNGRCESSVDLWHPEAAAMIRHLHELAGANDPRRLPMVNKIYYYAHQMKWQKTNDKGKVVADGKLVDEWMIKYSYRKKKLNAYTYDELPKLVSQFEQVYKDFLKRL